MSTPNFGILNSKNSLNNINLERNLKIYYQNVRSLRTKILNFKSNLILLHYDIYVITETRLSNDILSSELFPSEYLVFRCDRNINTSTSSRGGGTLVAVKKSLKPLNVCPINNKVEQTFLKLILPDERSLLIVGVYGDE